MLPFRFSARFSYAAIDFPILFPRQDRRGVVGKKQVGTVSCLPSRHLRTASSILKVMRRKNGGERSDKARRYHTNNFIYEYSQLADRIVRIRGIGMRAH